MNNWKIALSAPCIFPPLCCILRLYFMTCNQIVFYINNFHNAWLLYVCVRLFTRILRKFITYDGNQSVSSFYVTLHYVICVRIYCVLPCRVTKSV